MKLPKPATYVRVKRSQLLNEVVSSAVSLRLKRWWQICHARRWAQYQAFTCTSMLLKLFKCVNLIWSSAPRTASVKSVLCPFGENPLVFSCPVLFESVVCICFFAILSWQESESFTCLSDKTLRWTYFPIVGRNDISNESFDFFSKRLISFYESILLYVIGHKEVVCGVRSNTYATPLT